MKKRILSLLLALLMVLTAVAPAYADELGAKPITQEDIDNAMGVVTVAVKNLSEDIPADQASGIVAAFNGISDVFRTAGSFVSPINGGITFLKLIGVVKDKNTTMLNNITTQLTEISEQMEDVERKLNDITVKMAQVQAAGEFRDRTTDAILYRNKWGDFENLYMETGMDDLMTTFNSKMLDGMQGWCAAETPEARKVNGVDNGSLVLLYSPADEGYSLEYGKGNGLPGDLSDEARYLVLGPELLPGAISWNVNSYRDTIKTAIIENIRAKTSEEDYAFTAGNFPAFENPDELSDELLDEIADDAVNLLVYRVSAAELNRSSGFSLEVQQKFLLYCSHLIGSGEGLDAMYRAMFLTHAFEFEVADDFTEFSDRMAVKTGVYGTFALNVLGMSDFITDDEKVAALNSFCKALNTIGDCKRTGLTGKGNYCYLTNCCISLGELNISSGVDVKSHERSYINGYDGYSVQKTKTEITYGKDGKTADKSFLLGDDKTILIGYMLHSNGADMSFDYLNEHLGEGAASDYGLTVLKLDDEKALPTSDGTSLAVTNLIGRYFRGKSTMSLKSPPSDADKDYFRYRRQITGITMDNASEAINADVMLSALALYAEYHWIWEVDEAAVLGGPNGRTGLEHSIEKVETDLVFPGTYYYTTHYRQNVRYNCLICTPPATLSSDSSEGVLAGLRELNAELHAPYEKEPEEAPVETDTGGRESEERKVTSPETGGILQTPADLLLLTLPFATVACAALVLHSRHGRKKES